jgi:hypothetical protein
MKAAIILLAMMIGCRTTFIELHTSKKLLDTSPGVSGDEVDGTYGVEDI